MHAAHLPSEELILFHGQGEQRVWPIGQPASTMRWHPLPFTVSQSSPDLCSYTPPSGGDCYADIFCAGHVVLPDGRLFVAGGNVTGSGGGGGLVDTFTFNPNGADPDVAPFGWAKHEDMTVDRWYPTLTVIPGANPEIDPMGRVLISSGASRVEGGQNTFEVFDPNSGQVSDVTISGNSPFDDDNLIPLYPFIFVLPNGDIFYAGGEGAPDAAEDGRVLIPDYNNGGTWAWDGEIFESNVNGGSAVMYEPGKILKSGGVHRGNTQFPNGEDWALAATETIDLSSFASGDYGSAPNFTTVERDDMNRARHMHTLTLLPDGRVLATGGNSRDNGQSGDSPGNLCNYDGEPIGSETCTDLDGNGLPDGDPALGCPATAARCQFYDPDYQDEENPGPLPADYYCRFRSDAPCDGPQDDVGCGIPCTSSSNCPPGSTCGASGNCEMTCGEGECGPDPQAPCSGGAACLANGYCEATCGAVVHCSSADSTCDPANNACFATRTAELWEPCDGTWTQLGAQQRPRMYHSTALLLRDGRVISMGGGHRQGLAEQDNAEYILPEYGTAGTANVPVITVVGETNMQNDAPALPWDGQAQVMFANGSGSVTASDFTLVRLGSVTHQFDMDQRFMSLEISGGDVDSPGALTVSGPAETDVGPAAASAPPGYYMLFLRTDDGEVSTGQYVKVGPSVSAVYVCPATATLEATETSCTAEPIAGVCPMGSVQTDPLDLPRVDSPTGATDGWHVLVPAGEVIDSAAPTATELAAIEARCIAACEAHYASDPALDANCGDAGAFASPVHFLDDAAGPYDLILAGQKQGEGIFGTESLTCTLDETCHEAFDEELAAVVPDRTTPAADMLGVGEEYVVALGPTSEVEIVTDLGTYSSTLTGSAGYSFCRDGNAAAPCPFYVGSFEALAASNIAASMTCDDGTRARPTISNLVVKLSQPAFGIAQKNSTSVGFPKGALLFESAFDVGRQHFTARRPSRVDAVVTAFEKTFQASNLVVTMTVPCNDSTATIVANFTVVDPASGTALEEPPRVFNTTVTTGTCGVARALTANVSDVDGDAGAVRWRVDGVLLAPATASMIVTGSHVLEAVVRDARGATTTAKKVVSCS